MSDRPRRSPAQAIAWWWNTRIRSWWTVRLPAALRQRASAGVRQALVWADPGGELPARPDGQITAILTRYKRGQYLADQIAALRAQTVPPQEIWVWCNYAGEPAEDVTALADRVILADSNWKFWGRFALANMARTPFVCLFDDDILPPPRWLENCLATYAAGIDGILGGSGVILPAGGGYSSRHKVGWNGHHYDQPVAVDLVGHAWFMRKSMLKYMWLEEPASWDNGEDIHLSYMALKHAGVATYVPAHPEHLPDRWSCRPDFGKAVGRSSAATFKSEGHHAVRDEVVDRYRADGWQTVVERELPALPQVPALPSVAPAAPAPDVAGGPAETAPAPEQKDFAGDLRRFTQRLAEGEPFALVRFGDGEMTIIDGSATDLSHKRHGEHSYTPGRDQDEQQRELLRRSLTWRAPHYHVGIACPCCVGEASFLTLKRRSGQDEAHLTWANIFVNSNYPRFLDETVPVLASRTVNIVCREGTRPESLPFAVAAVFTVGANAWVTDHDRVLGELVQHIEATEHDQGQVFLFCAGVLSNILIYELARRFPQHTYVDVGSVFDVMLGLGRSRKYLRQGRTLKKTCRWQ